MRGYVNLGSQCGFVPLEGKNPGGALSFQDRVEIEIGGEWSKGVIMREANPHNPLILICPVDAHCFPDGRTAVEIDSRDSGAMGKIRLEGAGKGRYLRLQVI